MTCSTSTYRVSWHALRWRHRPEGGRRPQVAHLARKNEIAGGAGTSSARRGRRRSINYKPGDRVSLLVLDNPICPGFFRMHETFIVLLYAKRLRKIANKYTFAMPASISHSNTARKSVGVSEARRLPDLESLWRSYSAGSSGSIFSTASETDASNATASANARSGTRDPPTCGLGCAESDSFTEVSRRGG